AVRPATGVHLLEAGGNRRPGGPGGEDVEPGHLLDPAVGPRTIPGELLQRAAGERAGHDHGRQKQRHRTRGSHQPPHPRGDVSAAVGPVVFKAARNSADAAVGKARVARAGGLESRTAMWVDDVAISTHSLPSPGPEYDDFFQLSMGFYSSF